MNLIKIGNRFINLDNVYQISFNDAARENHTEKELEATLDVITSASTYDENSSPIEAAGVQVFGQEAEALRYYLNQSATNIENRFQEQLAREAINKRKSEWENRFEAFVKKGKVNDKRGYEMFLHNNAPFERWREPNEETYAQFVEMLEEQQSDPDIPW